MTMPDEDEGRLDSVRQQMAKRGYLVRITTAREGPNVVGRIHVTQAATDATIARVVASAKVDNLDLVIGIDAEESFIRDLLAQALNAADAIREAIPTITIREE
jgi:hypothetical protein